VKGSIPARRTVVLATSNKGKLRELRELLAELPIDLVTPPNPIHVVEDGETFEENARKKAVAVADALAMPALADDSGLEVDALGGRPGVRSARFAGEGATDAENNRKLLTELDALGSVPRTARFRCVLSFVDPVTRASFVTTGSCEGSITSSGRGTGGFGYDPLFVVEERQTMAELPDAEKNAKSHRAQAIKAMIPLLREWLEI
jgi:XTP/dITP diphosphohydrolase